MPDQLGVAIVGCGYWGINYVRVFSELSQSRVVGVCDRRPDRLQEVARRFPGVELADSVEDALRLDGVDAVVICTEATAHHDVARRFLVTGKHILVEKPMTTTAADAEDLIALAGSRGLTLMVGHTFLYNAGVRRVKAFIDEAEVGRIYYLYARRTNLGPIRRDVNALWDLSPHDISIFNYWLDSTPEWVSAVGAKVLRNSREDVGFVTLGYQDGIIGHVHVSWADPNKVREVILVGSDKRVVFNDLSSLERVRVFEKGVTPLPPEAASYGEYHFLMRDGDIVSPRIEVSEPLKNQCRHFLECVAEDRRPLTDGQAGLDIVRVMEAINRSIDLNGAPVEILTVPGR
jgi:predicted dehydrogenase